MFGHPDLRQNTANKLRGGILFYKSVEWSPPFHVNSLYIAKVEYGMNPHGNEAGLTQSEKDLLLVTIQVADAKILSRRSLGGVVLSS